MRDMRLNFLIHGPPPRFDLLTKGMDLVSTAAFGNRILRQLFSCLLRLFLVNAVLKRLPVTHIDYDTIKLFAASVVR